MNKKITKNCFVAAWLITMGAATSLYAQTPPIINIPATPCNMIINNQSAECLTNCVIPSNCTLTIENGAHAVLQEEGKAKYYQKIVKR